LFEKTAKQSMPAEQLEQDQASGHRRNHERQRNQRLDRRLARHLRRASTHPSATPGARISAVPSRATQA